VADFPAPIGARVAILRGHDQPLAGEVIGFRAGHALVTPFGETTGLRPGDRVQLVATRSTLPLGSGLLGRVVDALGKPRDAGPSLAGLPRGSWQGPAPSAWDRPRIDEPLPTGIRAVDALLTCGCGQRLGIFAGAGVGKSSLLGMLARGAQADALVLALVGERGREVRDFLEQELSPEILSRTVVTISTSDEPAALRVRAAHTATAIAESLRDEGRHVLLLMDSLTRLAQAQRELSLAAGEPPAARGWPASVLTMLPPLLERAGRTQVGSITAFYTVLVEDDDPHDPLAEAVRGWLDGHIWLSQRLAARGHHPAIDLLQSLSRLQPQVTSCKEAATAATIRELLAELSEHQDLLTLGAYRAGLRPRLDVAVALRTDLEAFLRQPRYTFSDWDATWRCANNLQARAAALLKSS